MADKLQKVPGKGILKSSSFDKNDPLKSSHKEMKWDEMNILQTLHPPGKDYGHMKISEPKTPYSYYKDSDDNDREAKSDDETDGLDADLLAKKIQIGSTKPPKALVEDESEEDEDETEEQRAKRKVFEQKRKMHYNEYYAVKLARKLMEQEDDDDDDDDDDENRNKDQDEEDEDEDEENNGREVEQEVEMSSSDVQEMPSVSAVVQDHPSSSRGKPAKIQKE